MDFEKALKSCREEFENKINDHDRRLRELEVSNSAKEEVNKTLFNLITDLKDTLKRLEGKLEDSVKNALTEISKNFVTKDQIALVEKDGKYKMLWGGIVGAVATFVILTLAGKLLGV